MPISHENLKPNNYHTHHQQTSSTAMNNNNNKVPFKFYPLNSSQTSKSIADQQTTTNTKYFNINTNFMTKFIKTDGNSMNQENTTTTTTTSEKILNKLVHNKDSGKIMKRSNLDRKRKKISNYGLIQCFNLNEKEKYRELIAQNTKKSPTTAPVDQLNTTIKRQNAYKNLVQTSPTQTYDDNLLTIKNRNDAEKKIYLPVSNFVTSKISSSYSRRITIHQANNFTSNTITRSPTSSINSKTEKPTDLNENEIIIINEKLSNTNNNLTKKKNLTNSLNNHQNGTNISLNTNQASNASVRLNNSPNKLSTSNSLMSSRILAPTRKIIRQLSDYEKNFEENFSKTNSIIESILEKCKESKLNSNTIQDEENRYLLIKRQRMEDEIKLAKQFSERLQLDVNNLSKYYYEEEKEVEDIEDEFPELTDEHQSLINDSLRLHPQDEVLTSAFNINITRKDIQTLRGLNWLNDEIINFYMNLICARCTEVPNNCCEYQRVYAFSTFFYPKLLKDGFSALKRWTRKVDIFSYGLILIPVHLGLHWTLAVIDFNCKEIRYYDSMNGHNNECLRALKNYLKDEHLDKKQSQLDLTQWNMLHVDELPLQMNGSDCGMFTCKYAEFLSRGKTAFSFDQSDMPYYRQRMIWEIINKKLM